MGNNANISNYARKLLAQKGSKGKPGRSRAPYVSPVNAQAKSAPQAAHAQQFAGLHPQVRNALAAHIDSVLARLGAPPNGG